MNKEQKKNYITDITTQFENSEAVMVTHYQGLTMSQLDELREQMRVHGIIFKITKNRITKLALEKTKCKDLTNLFAGPRAVKSGTEGPWGDITLTNTTTNFTSDNTLKMVEAEWNNEPDNLTAIESNFSGESSNNE